MAKTKSCLRTPETRLHTCTLLGWVNLQSAKRSTVEAITEEWNQIKKEGATGQVSGNRRMVTVCSSKIVTDGHTNRGEPSLSTQTTHWHTVCSLWDDANTHSVRIPAHSMSEFSVTDASPHTRRHTDTQMPWSTRGGGWAQQTSRWVN